MIKVLITGAGGMLGREAATMLEGHCDALARADLDITDLDAVSNAVDASAPNVILNAAAYTDVDGAESDRDNAYAVNATGPENLARVAAERGIFLIHVSTDFVFDGSADRAYTEYDDPNPICVYAASKLEGERRVLNAAPDAAVVRVAWLYGAGHRTFLSQILDRARSGQDLNVVDDQAGSPTWVRDLANGLTQLIERPAGGVFHLAGGGVATRFEFGQAIVEAAGIDPVIVHAVKTSDFPARPAPRPAYAPLESKRWAEHGFVPLRPWRDALNEAIKDFM